MAQVFTGQSSTRRHHSQSNNFSYWEKKLSKIASLQPTFKVISEFDDVTFVDKQLAKLYLFLETFFAPTI